MSAQSLKARAAKARQFPSNTCPASRHVQMIGESLLKHAIPHALLEEPAHAAESMLAVVAALWEARTKIAALERGEFICTKCGLRKDSEHEKGDF